MKKFDFLSEAELNILLNAVMYSMGNRDSFKPRELEDLCALAIEIEKEIVDRGKDG